MTKKAKDYYDRCDVPVARQYWLSCAIKRAIIRAYDAGRRQAIKEWKESIK